MAVVGESQRVRLAKTAALAFEVAWQKPHSNGHLKRVWAANGERRCALHRTRLNVRLRALRLLLDHGVLALDPLRVRVVSSVCEPEVRELARHVD